MPHNCMIARIVHTAGDVDRPVTVRIQNVPVGINELLRQIRTLHLLGHGDERHGSVFRVAVATPFKVATRDAGTALVGIVEVQGKLECLRKVDVRLLERVRIGEHFFLCRVERLSGSGTCTDGTGARQQDGGTGEDGKHPFSNSWFHHQEPFFLKVSIYILVDYDENVNSF